MTQSKCLAIARLGFEHWNNWRRKNANAEIDFSGIDFTLDENKSISFSGFDFGDRANFTGAKFGKSANFERARFGNYATFRDATFGDDARFKGSVFGNEADLMRATFGAEANFQGAKFSDVTQFTDASFGTNAHFRGASFGEFTRFSAASFGADANFCGALFNGAAVFEGVTFEGAAFFEASNSCAYFNSIDFSGTKFLGKATFADRDFKSEADFSFAVFAEPPDFRATKNRDNLDLMGARFGFGARIRGWTTKSETVVRLRRLRGVANEIHAVDAERDLFILERQAERGVLWRNWWREGWRSRLFHWWPPMSATLLMFLYRWSSDCGRSVFWPVIWLFVLNYEFYHLYARLIDRPLFIVVKKALRDFNFASAIPFGATARPSFQSAVQVLFQKVGSGAIDIPDAVQIVSAVQGIVNLVLLFLLGLALRNYFKFR